MTDIDLDAIERLAKAATPGPWTTGADKKWSDALPSWALIISPGYPLIELDDGPQGAADADFIAATRTAVPQMVAELRQHRAKRDTPPAVELTDRELALAVRRWAVANGWTCHRWHGWINAATESAATIGVDWSTEDEDVTLRRRDPSGWWRYDVYPVGSLTQAVDLLAALDVLPAELSSAWRAGQAARP